MQPRTRIGLLVGVIGLVLNICVSGFIGFGGPLLSLIAGDVAGAGHLANFHQPTVPHPSQDLMSS